ncbi:MAG: hypothetical protein AAGD38_15330 [Acidobacteriota bacterium]
MQKTPTISLTALLLPLTLLLTGCSTTLPTWQAAPAAPDQAAELLATAVAAHGGDAYGELSNVAVSYDGFWGRLVPRLQPILSDTKFRRASEERYWPREQRVWQRHEGPDGIKTVIRGPNDEVAVRYFTSDEEREGSTDEHAASALVADAYTLFLFGPSYIEHHAQALSLLEPGIEDGKSYPRILARLSPGFGLSEEDRVALWFDPDTDRLFRVHFSIDGFESTQGATVDVTFSDYREIGGYYWPTHFRERVRAPVRAFAHEWRTVGLDVERAAMPSFAGSELDDAPAQVLSTR